jgi:hypothetical protein
MIKVCLYCGKEFKGDRTSKYCSRECVHKSQIRKVSLVCPICNRTVLVRNGAKYCGRACANKAKIVRPVRETFSKKCKICNKPFKTVKSNKECCSAKCHRLLIEQRMIETHSEEYLAAVKQGRSATLKYLWTTEGFREKYSNRMHINNPSQRPEVAAKIRASRIRNNSYTNNFKYGNGIMSPEEQIAYEYLKKYDFIYNYAIPTKPVRKMYPDRRYPFCYKPDFVNLEHHLCIEIDGNNHTKPYQIELDRKKDGCLGLLGYRVIRFSNSQVANGEFIKEVEEICHIW